MTDRFPETDKQRQNRQTFAAAARFVAAFVAAAVLMLLIAMQWLNGCKSGAESLHPLENCNTFQRNIFALGSPVVLTVGGVWAFVRTYRAWRDGGSWWIWQGAGWFLLVLMIVVLTMTVPTALL